MSSKTVIIGAGQLAYYLVKNEYPDALVLSIDEPSWIEELGAKYSSLDISQADMVVAKLDLIKPDLIINTAAISSIAQSFCDIPKTFEINLLGPLYLMEYMLNNKNIKLIQCSSTEAVAARTKDLTPDYSDPTFIDYGGMFNEVVKDSESKPVLPAHPYGSSKAVAQHLTDIYRKSHGLDVRTAILSNLESSIRPDTFLTSKVINYIKQLKEYNNNKITNGKAREPYPKLKLGNLSSRRSFLHASDGAAAIRCLANAQEPKDYVIAAPSSHSVKEFVDRAFQLADMESYSFMYESVSEFKRDYDSDEWVRICSKQTQKDLGWSPKLDLDDIIREMLNG
jgi:GDPmannose 4,6-dehydratase